jgi:AcrR family transcriptional regulator
METIDAPAGVSRGGRGARERILRTAVELFARDGIHATGIAKLTHEAHVSTRTFYQHFPSKEALVSAYVERVGAEPDSLESALDRHDLTARERLLHLFDELPANQAHPPVLRGCPLHNTAVEAAGNMPEATALVERHKREFTARLIKTAAEAGAPDPDLLGRQLALLFEGCRALSTSLNNSQPIHDARELAATLIDQTAT